MSLTSSILLLFISFNSFVYQGKAQIEFDKLEHNFGVITQDKKVTHVFTFKNTGDDDLIIEDVISTCGCTVPDFSKEPIASGEKGNIIVTFNPYGKSGRQSKYIKVQNNATEKPITLKIIAFVE